jgi:hypothetical protein
MQQRRYTTLLDDLVAAAQAPAVLPEAAGLASEAAPPLVAKAWRRLRKAVRRAGATPPDEALHRIRIRAKRARYAAEAVKPVLGKPARAFATQRPTSKTSSASSTTRSPPRHGCGSRPASRQVPRPWPPASWSPPSGPPRRQPGNAGGRRGNRGREQAHGLALKRPPRGRIRRR